MKSSRVLKMKKQYPLRVDSEVLKKLAQIAASEKRSLNQQIEKVLEDFVDKRKNEKRVSVEVGDL